MLSPHRHLRVCLQCKNISISSTSKRHIVGSSSPAHRHSKSPYDVVVVGGGPIGLSVAYHCALKGLGKIAVVERDKGYQISSFALSAGGVRQQFSVAENVKMSMYGAQFIRDPEAMAVDGEVPDFQFKPHGYLFLASTEQGKSALEQNHRVQRSCGADWIDLLSPTELRENFPWLNTTDIKLGSYGTKNEGYFDPWSLILSMGVDVFDGEVVGARISQSSPSHATIVSLSVRPSLSATHNDFLTTNTSATTTTTETATAAQYKVVPAPYDLHGGLFVNAAGAFAGQLVRMLASECQRPAAIAPLPVEPRKRCIFTVHCPVPISRSENPCPPPTTPLVVDPSGAYFRPDGNTAGKFLMGVSPDEADDPDCSGDDWESTRRALEIVQEKEFTDVIWPALYERVPAFEELKVTSSWAGFYEYNTLDQNAIIGYHPELKNLALVNGFSGHGLQQSPAAGRAISELIMSGREERFETIDLRRFSFDRILKKEPILETGII